MLVAERVKEEVLYKEQKAALTDLMNKPQGIQQFPTSYPIAEWYFTKCYSFCEKNLKEFKYKYTFAFLLLLSKKPQWNDKPKPSSCLWREEKVGQKRQDGSQNFSDYTLFYSFYLETYFMITENTK